MACVNVLCSRHIACIVCNWLSNLAYALSSSRESCTLSGLRALPSAKQLGSRVCFVTLSDSMVLISQRGKLLQGPSCVHFSALFYVIKVAAPAERHGGCTSILRSSAEICISPGRSNRRRNGVTQMAKFCF